MNSKENEVAQVPQQLPASITPMQMLQIAVERGADMAQMEKLMELDERWQANQARRAYVEAMNAFKQNPPALFKGKEVSYQTSKGVTAYKHATLDHVANQVSESMSEHGLSFRWDTKQEEGKITVSCVVTHEMGHSERTSLTASPDDSGGKNSIQAIGSTVSYLQRYTLLAITGLATRDQDDDARGAEPAESISKEQIDHIKSLIKKSRRSEEKVCEWLKVETLSDLTVDVYEKVCTSLESFT